MVCLHIDGQRSMCDSWAVFVLYYVSGLKMASPLVLTVLCIGLAAGTYVSHNVVFKKVSEVTTARSRWTVTFVIDLQPYLWEMGRLSASIKNATDIAWQIVQHYFESESEDKSRYVNSFMALNRDLRTVQDTYNGLLDIFAEYRLLQKKDSSRTKRSLLPFVGKALSFLFGTVSESDLVGINAVISQLA